MTENDNSHRNSTSFTVGAIALIFLALGYQTALFIHKASISRIISNSDSPDTVYVYETVPAASLDNNKDSIVRKSVRKESKHSAIAQNIKEKYGSKQVESFPFDPNTVTSDELVRLGFSRKQAQSIINYREAGGQFNRKEDFAKSYVVSDSTYRRLENFIRINKIDINHADSADFDRLPGIGPYYAAKLIEYRDKLGGYSHPEQIMDIHNFGQERYDNIKDLIELSEPKAFMIWSLPEDSLAMHPYLDRHAAHGIVIYRENNPMDKWDLNRLKDAGVISVSQFEKLSKCNIR